MFDVACWVATFGVQGLDAMAMTSDLSLRFLRPAVGSRLFARVDIDSVGSRMLAMSGAVWTDTTDRSKPCSVAYGTYALPRHADGPPKLQA